ncbi:Rhodopsin, GQ-coupled [Trichoplax sp. H2]|nr:Rhodopsin, GQ-coupled [Trichoplax sp. H2]|eukprot:RDD37903.1 Rhodopsin, GQ-coupled [Trichoplax sp. H2]
MAKNLSGTLSRTLMAFNMSLNQSIVKTVAKQEFRKLQITLPIIALLASLGILVNAMICYGILKKKTLQTSTFYLLINLGVSHSFILFTSAAITVTNCFLALHLMGTPTLAASCKFSYYVNGIACILSMVTLIAISIERYHMITPGLSRRTSMLNTSRKLKTIITLTWVVGILIALPILTLADILAEYPYMCNIRYISFNFNIAYFTSLFIAALLIPIITVNVIYIKIMNFLRQNETPTDGQLRNYKILKKNYLHHLKTVKLLILVTVTFILTCTPFFMANLIIAYNAQNSVYFFLRLGRKTDSISFLGNAFLILLCIQSPLIFLYSSQSIRSALPFQCCSKFRRSVMDTNSENRLPKILTVSSFNNFVVSAGS